jgi:hypothetical protein
MGVTVLTSHGMALGCTFALSVMFAGTACSQPGPVANADFSCVYAPKTKGEMVDVEHCAWSGADGRLHLMRQNLRELDFDRFGLASVFIDGWYYVRRDGRLAPVMTMDNGADSFTDGLARSPVGGKIGFINRNLALVIPARYDGAFPFEHGWASVCIDCKATSDGEHSWYVGGRWGCIDPHGHEREPFKPDQGDGHLCRDEG